MQTHLEFRVVITGYVLVVLTLSTVTAVVTVQSVSATSANQTGIHTGSNMTFVGNMTQGKSMMIPGGNMTFGASLQNAKMHLLEAMMDLKIGNSKGAMTELSLTNQSINMHMKEIKSMMIEVKSMIMQMKGNTKNTTSRVNNST